MPFRVTIIGSINITNLETSQHQSGKFSRKFSERLRALRGTRKAKDMAAFLGVENPATYSRYEAGRVPDLEILADWANRLGISLDYLAGRDAPVKREEPGANYKALKVFTRVMEEATPEELRVLDEFLLGLDRLLDERQSRSKDD